MRRGIVGKLMLAGAAALLACGLSVGTALATPTCTTTMNLGPSATGVLNKSSFTSGFCVQANDKIYGNFHISGLPAATVVIFNLNPVGPLDYYQIAFSGAYQSGHTYNWSYEVAVAPFAPPLTAIVGIQTDFSQTIGNSSALTEITIPAASATLSLIKNGAIATPASVTQASYTPGVTDLVVNLHLADHGTISSVTNTIIQFSPGNNIPEPLSLSLFGAGLAGLGMARRKRRA